MILTVRRKCSGRRRTHHLINLLYSVQSQREPDGFKPETRAYAKCFKVRIGPLNPPEILLESQKASDKPLRDEILEMRKGG
jgi:hypothetical protein